MAVGGKRKREETDEDESWKSLPLLLQSWTAIVDAEVGEALLLAELPLPKESAPNEGALRKFEKAQLPEPPRVIDVAR